MRMMKNNLKKVLALSDSVRCNVIYLVLNEAFRKVLEIELKYFGYSKSENEFWAYSIEEAKKINSNPLFLAESYFE